MTEQKKKVSIGVFHVLKSIMDNKAQTLQNDVLAGDAAEHEHQLMHEHIAHLQRYASRNYSSDPAEAREAEDLIESYEYQMKGIGKKIERGNIARKQLPIIKDFNTTYYDVCDIATTAQRIKDLMARRNTLEMRLASVEKNIESCEISAMPDTYRTNVTEQAQSDLERYNAEYARLTQDLQNVNRELAYLRTK